MNSSDRYSDWDAAYVLGALSPAERREFEQHKSTCGSCAAAVESLAGMPGLLADVPAVDVGRLISGGPDPTGPVPDELLRSLLAAARVSRLRRRAAVSVVLAAAAAVLLLATGVPHLGSSRPAAVAMAQLVQSPVHVDVRLQSQSWGTRIDVHCSYDRPPGTDPYPARAYSMVVIDRSGAQTVAASWKSVAGSTAWPTGSVAVPLTDIAAVQIRADDGVPILQLNR
jgi:RNA polymerase sigma-70 factor (ECF subfamily)